MKNKGHVGNRKRKDEIKISTVKAKQVKEQMKTRSTGYQSEES